MKKIAFDCCAGIDEQNIYLSSNPASAFAENTRKETKIYWPVR